MKNIKKKLSKKPSMEFTQYGAIIFIIGMAIAIIAGLFNAATLGETGTKIVIVTLVILGLVIGFLNVTSKESVPFLVASVALIMLLGPFLGLITQYLFSNVAMLTRIFSNVIAFIVPAAIVVAIRTFIITAKDE